MARKEHQRHAAKNQARPSKNKSSRSEKKGTPRATFNVETLEPRILLSATWVDTDVTPVDDAPEGQDGFMDEVADEVTTAGTAGTAEDVADELFDELAAVPTESAPLNIVLIDSTLDDVDALRDAVEEGATIIEYDGANMSMVDVLAQVEALSESSGSRIESLSVLSHGSGGRFDLGNDVVSDEMTDDQLAAWQSLADNFTDDANIYVYGCNVVDGSGEGQDLLNRLSQLTGTEVYGSTDTTGAGGDWKLEAVSAGGEAELAEGVDTDLDEAALADYESDLADFNEADFSGSQTFIDGGISFTVDVSGGGTIDFSYDGATDTLTITDTDGTSSSTSVTITDNNGGLNISNITIADRSPIGTLISNVDIGTLSILDKMEDSTFNVIANINTLSFEKIEDATINVTGDVGSLVGTDRLEESTVTISGDLDSINIARYDTPITITANAVIGQFNMSGAYSYSNTLGSATQVIFNGSCVSAPGAPNLTPDAVADAVSTNEDTAVTTVNVLTNDTDPDCNTLSITGFTQAGNGTVVNNGDGTFTYTPNANFSGSDSFTYTVDDGNGGTDTATINVTVNAVNDAPTATAGSLTITEDASATAVTLSGSDLDAGDSVESYRIDTLAANGTLKLNGVVVNTGDVITQAQINANNLTFEPDAGYVGPTSFTFSVNDGDDWSASTALFSITVDAAVLPPPPPPPPPSPNEAPVTADDSVATVEDVPVTTGNVLANDSDPDGDLLGVTDFTQAAHGAVVHNGNGTFTYTPDAGFVGSDSFTYTASDQAGASSTSTVWVTVGKDASVPVVDVENPPADPVVDHGNVGQDATEPVPVSPISSTPPPPAVDSPSVNVTIAPTVPEAIGSQPEVPAIDAPTTEIDTRAPAAEPATVQTEPGFLVTRSGVVTIGSDPGSPVSSIDDVEDEVIRDGTADLEIPDADKDLAESVDHDSAAKAEAISPGIDVFAAVGGPEYPSVALEVDETDAEFATTDFAIGRAGLPIVPRDITPGNFYEIFQPVRLESDEVLAVSDLTDLPPWEFDSSGTPTEKEDAPLGEGPTLTDAEAGRAREAVQKAEALSPGGFFALVWSLVRGFGKPGSLSTDERLPDEKQGKARR